MESPGFINNDMRGYEVINTNFSLHTMDASGCRITLLIRARSLGIVH